MIFSHVLYQLSYPGIASGTWPAGRSEVGDGPSGDWKRAYGEGAAAWQAPLYGRAR